MTDGKRSRLVLVVTLLVGLGGVGILLLTRRMGRTSKEIDELRAELSAVQKRNLILPMVIHQVQGEPNGQHESAGPAESELKAATKKENEPLREETEEKLRLINEARSDLCDKTFAVEAADSMWSERAARLIREKYSGPEFATLTISTGCRSTLCKIDFSFSDPAAGPMAVKELLSSHPWPSQRFTRFDQEGKRGVSYLAREGSELPQLKAPLR